MTGNVDTGLPVSCEGLEAGTNDKCEPTKPGETESQGLKGMRPIPSYLWSNAYLCKDLSIKDK